MEFSIIGPEFGVYTNIKTCFIEKKTIDKEFCTLVMYDTDNLKFTIKLFYGKTKISTQALSGIELLEYMRVLIDYHINIDDTVKE